MGNVGKPEVATVLQGLKPYLGVNGQAFTDGLLSILNVFTSQAGQEALAAVTKIMPSRDKFRRRIAALSLPEAGKKESGPVAKGAPVFFNQGFMLFLVLILLSGGFFAKGVVGGSPEKIPKKLGKSTGKSV